MLDEVHLAERDEGGLLALAVDPLVDRDVAVEPPDAGIGQMHGFDARHHALDAVEQRAFLWDRAHHPVVGVTDEDVLVDCVAPMASSP